MGFIIDCVQFLNYALSDESKPIPSRNKGVILVPD